MSDTQYTSETTDLTTSESDFTDSDPVTTDHDTTDHHATDCGDDPMDKPKKKNVTGLVIALTITVCFVVTLMVLCACIVTAALLVSKEKPSAAVPTTKYITYDRASGEVLTHGEITSGIVPKTHLVKDDVVMFVDKDVELTCDIFMDCCCGTMSEDRRDVGFICLFGLAIYGAVTGSLWTIHKLTEDKCEDECAGYDTSEPRNVMENCEEQQHEQKKYEYVYCTGGCEGADANCNDIYVSTFLSGEYDSISDAEKEFIGNDLGPQCWYEDCRVGTVRCS